MSFFFFFNNDSPCRPGRAYSKVLVHGHFKTKQKKKWYMEQQSPYIFFALYNRNNLVWDTTRILREATTLRQSWALKRRWMGSYKGGVEDGEQARSTGLGQEYRAVYSSISLWVKNHSTAISRQPFSKAKAVNMCSPAPLVFLFFLTQFFLNKAMAGSNSTSPKLYPPLSTSCGYIFLF